MSIDLETFVKELTESGIIAPGRLENFIPPKAHPQSAEELVAELVKQNELTNYQAEEINEGRGKSLMLGGYTILDKIGAGGMGQVFKAEHRRMDRKVAIKMLPTAMTKDAAAVARFEREVRAAAKLFHPNIVPALDADQANGVHFLVMEYVDGKDLSALVKNDGPFPVAKAVNYILQAAKGLEFAHKKGVIHRDIKPANLLLDGEGTVRILDMGLARIEEGDGPVQAELTGTGAVMGTVDYMAPEQGLSTKHADARADIYSLGCTLYYLIAGKPTYDGETVAAKLVAHHTRPIPSLREVQPDIPKQVEAVFKKMVAKTVEDRYQTMSQVVADLEKCQATFKSEAMTEATAAWQSSDTKEALSAAGGKKPPQKNIKLLAGAAGFLLMLLGVIVIVRNKDGKEVARLEVPDGNSVEVQPTPEKATTVTPVKSITTFNDPGFQQWTKDVAAMPAEEQVKAVSKKLMEVNPGFDGKVTGVDGKPTPKIDNGVVTELRLVTDNVIDISPVRALVGLKALTCSGSFAGGIRNGKLSNLSPLKELPLTTLVCNDSRVTDLSPLQEMPLTKLSCGETPVSDLSPLRGMPLTSITCYATNVSDLSPLSGMLLTSLMCNGTKVSNLSPLEGMPLTSLSFSGTQVSDLSPLRGMPLTTIECDHTPVTDLSPLQGMKLTTFCFTPKNIAKGADLIRQLKSLKTIGVGWQRKDQFPSDEFWKKYDADEFGKAVTNINDLAFQQWTKEVQAMPADKQIDAVSKKLVELNPGFDGVVTGYDKTTPPKIENGKVTELGFVTENVTDISPVRALVGLKFLRCSGGVAGKGKLSDLAPLEGMKLATLNCSYTQISNLSPLKGMTLTTMECSNTRVADLSPLEGMLLTNLGCDGTQVTDLSPLQRMPLAKLHCHYTQVSDLSPLKGMKLANMLCHHTQVSDLSPLEDCKTLTSLNVKATKVTVAGVAALQKALPNCTIDWDDPSKAAATQPTQPWNTPAFQAWMKEVQAMPAEEQIKAVSKKLMELNPGFDGKVRGADGKNTPKIEKGVVTELRMVTDNVTDISPVRALMAVTHLDCSGGSSGKGKLSDLSPLRGMPLTDLSFGHTKVADLSPLEGMRLTSLGCSSTAVSDLSPLQGMPLTFINCYATPVANLSPLQAMPLTFLDCSYTKVTDLTPLKGMELTELRCHSTQISDLSPLKGLPLTTLNCNGTRISDLSSLAGTTLRDLEVKATKVTPAGVAALQKALPNCKIEWDGASKPITTFNDPAFQQWMNIVAAMPAEKQIEAVSKKLVELNPGFDGKLMGANGASTPKIAGGVVTELGFDTISVTDISPVGALMGLKVLSCNGSSWQQRNLSDLLPLQGLKLTRLNCDNTQVSDLSPLRGMPLSYLKCYGTKVSDLSPLAECKSLATLIVGSSKVTSASVAALQKALPNCKIEWDDPAKVAATQPNKPWNTPAFQKWMKEVAAMPAEEQVKAVSKKLVELNPGFDGKVIGWHGSATPKIENGVVTAFGFVTDKVTDISPVRALLGLTALKCVGSGMGNAGTGKVADLSPLHGLPLVALDCGHNQVSNLSPLAGMRLTELRCGDTKVSDLSPLQGMPVTNLMLHITKVSDLSPLHGMPLTNLTLYDTSVSDLTPLHGLPLVSLDCGHNQVSTLSPLTGMKLTELRCGDTKVSDLSPLHGLPLVALDCGHTQVSNLSPLAGMKLTELRCGDTKVSDLTPLHGLPLVALDCGQTQVSNLSPLAGMKLTELRCDGTKVSDLSALRDMPLKRLVCHNSPISDLSPLKGVPLERLECVQTQLSDISPLQDCKGLKFVDAKGNKVTPASVTALQKALPNCKIEWDDPAKPTTPPLAPSGTK